VLRSYRSKEFLHNTIAKTESRDSINVVGHTWPSLVSGHLRVTPGCRHPQRDVVAVPFLTTVLSPARLAGHTCEAEGVADEHDLTRAPVRGASHPTKCDGAELRFCGDKFRRFSHKSHWAGWLTPLPVPKTILRKFFGNSGTEVSLLQEL
jgi:hypothetical protein